MAVLLADATELVQVLIVLVTVTVLQMRVNLKMTRMVKEFLR